MAVASIIGGSISGLFTALLLRQAGWQVQVFERSPGDLASRGAGVGTHPEQFVVMRRLGIVVDERIGVGFTERLCLDQAGEVVARMPFDKVQTAWALLYRRLRELLPDGCYRPGMRLVAVEQGDAGVTAVFEDGTRVTSDLLVGADGVNGAVRGLVFGGPQPRYAGYVAWRGVVPETEVPEIAREHLVGPFGFFVTPREKMLSYLQPGPDDDHAPGKRGLNWVWYHPTSAATLAENTTDATGTRHAQGIPPPLIRAEVIARFRAEAEAILPPQYRALVAATPRPFFQPIVDLDCPAVTEGRVALVGDAAYMARPHVAAGIAKAALNAMWLADAMADGSGLAGYAAKAEPFGHAMVARARHVGAFLEDPPRDGLPGEPVAVMLNTGSPLAEIPGLAAFLPAIPASPR